MSLDKATSRQLSTFADSFKRYRSEAGRVKLWVDRISNVVNISRDSFWLDVGCGSGRFTIPIATLCRKTVGLDKSAEILALAREKESPSNIQWLIADGLRMPFSEGVFDFLLLSMVLEHVKDKNSLLSEIRHVLRKGGKLVIRTCTDADLDNTTWYRYFPEALRLEKKRMPETIYLRSFLLSLGFFDISIRSYLDTHKVPRDQFLEKMRAKAYTGLWQLKKEDFDEGLKLIEGDGEAGREVEETIGASLLVATKK